MKATVEVDIEKSDWEVVRVRAGLYEDEERVDLRIFYRGRGGQLRPTKRGIAFEPDLLPALINALEQIRAAQE